MAVSLPLGVSALELVADIRRIRNQPPVDPVAIRKVEADDKQLQSAVKKYGIFLNSNTLETEIAQTNELVDALLSILEAENFGAKRRERIDEWREYPSMIDAEQLLSMIADVGKGRLAGRLAAKANGLKPPKYIEAALHYLVNNV
jgi:putative ATP-dependent endonuclease of OLD family